MRRLTSRSFWFEDISNKNADLLLLVASIGVGVIDAFTFPQLKVFAANMTGNTVFLALAAAQVNDNQLSASRSIVALASFWAGSFVSGQIGHIVGPRVRWWVMFALFWQGMCVLASAIIIWSNGVSGLDITSLNDRVLALLTLLAFAYGAQGTTARGLGIAEIPTVVVTSAMVDLFGDKNLFKRNNRGRNRRIGFIFAVFIGGFIGGWVVQRVNAALTIAVAAAFKFVCLPSILFFNSAADEKRLQEERKQRELLAKEYKEPV